MITIRNRELNKKIKNLLRPRCKSIPETVNIYDDSTVILWKNNQACTVKAYVTSVYINHNRIELIFCNAINKQFIGAVSIVRDL